MEPHLEGNSDDELDRTPIQRPDGNHYWGGIGGLAAAIGLQEMGYDVEVYEQAFLNQRAGAESMINEVYHRTGTRTRFTGRLKVKNASIATAIETNLKRMSRHLAEDAAEQQVAAEPENGWPELGNVWSRGLTGFQAGEPTRGVSGEGSIIVEDPLCTGPSEHVSNRLAVSEAR